MNAYPIRKTIQTFLLFSFSFTQSINIQGKIFTQKNEPISGVNIYTEDVGTSSQFDGSFSLNVDANVTVTFSHVGFSDISMLASEIGDTIQLNTIELSVPAIIVKGGLRNTSLLNSASSISIIGESTLRNESSPHFQGLIQTIPNLNWAGGTSRPRYFQIRGIGERSQYTGEGAPNFSVGYMIDGIDFSGIGMAGMLFDVQQIEVFRGPQSSIYGPNAMAGLINVSTAEPTPYFTGNTIIKSGSDNLTTAGFSVGGPLFSDLFFRFAFQKNDQNGFRNNLYHNLFNTNKRNEILTRTKLNWIISPFVNLQFVTINANLNNNYDAWSVDNNIDFLTYTDKQGIDSQITKASSVKIKILDNVGVNSFYKFTTSTNEMEHSYDGDWANNDYWLESPYNFDPAVTWWEYNFYDKSIRNRERETHEIRISSSETSCLSWILGYYLSNITEIDDANGWLFGGEATSLKSSFEINHNSIYSQINLKIMKRLNLTVNFRSENEDANYQSDGLNFDVQIPIVKEQFQHSFYGGRLAIIYDLKNTTKLFGSISRGYKAGGINQNPYLSESSRFYDPEYNTNLEVGIKFFDENLITNITAFSMRRTNQQVQISSQQEEGNSNSFFYYTSNASKGTNDGAELDIKLKVDSNLSIRSSIGLLKTHVDVYEFWENDSTVIILGDREQAMAPLFNYSIGSHYSHNSGFYTDFEITGKDQYYFSDSHNQKSEAYQLLNLTTGYSKDAWSISLWGKNILDTRYATRGFYFGNEPIWNESEDSHEYPDKLYLSYGDPLQYGISFQYSF